MERYYINYETDNCLIDRYNVNYLTDNGYQEVSKDIYDEFLKELEKRLEEEFNEFEELKKINRR